MAANAERGENATPEEVADLRRRVSEAEKHLPLPERPRAIRRWLAQAEPSEGASESPTRFLRSTRNPGQGTDIGKSDAAVPTSPASP